MILSKAQETASAFAEQPITGAVITVPAFFSQAERRAVELACDLAGIKLLQLMTDNAAVALNYGVFRYIIMDTQMFFNELYLVGALFS